MSLSVPVVQRFRRAFEGQIVLPHDDAYDDARRVWNAVHDRRPGLVVRPTGQRDVAAAIRFAREQQLRLAVRAGGHSAGGLSTCDDGLVIDLSAMRGVTVDPTTAIARANGGALLAELDEAGQAHRLVCPIGVVGHTGLAGLTLGGGMGRLQRKLGLTIDSLRAVELITAEGRAIRASEAHNPELFWAIRGAGANFGVVTSFELQLHPFGPKIHRGVRMYPATAVQDVWELFRDYAEEAPEDVSGFFILGRAEPAEDYPEAIAGQTIALIAYNHAGPADNLERDLAPLDRGPAPSARTDVAIDYLEIQTANDEALGWGRRSYITGAMVDGLSPATLDRLVAHVDGAPTGESTIGVSMLGGAIARLPADATAFAGRHARFDVSADTTWDDPALDDRAARWCLEALAIAGPDLAGGRYSNEVTESSPEVTRAIYGDAALARLTKVKREWDPDNVFRLNHNIDPRA
jgi:FAD/FMN-containing dehydrogenase